MAQLYLDNSVAGRLVWERIRDRLGLLDTIQAFDCDDPDERHEARARVVAFMLSAAFAYMHDLDKKSFEDRVRHYKSRLDHNKDFYVFSTTQESDLEVETGSGTFSLEKIRGFATIYPLTQLGFDDYINNKLNTYELDKCHLVQGPFPEHGVRYLLLGGAVNFPSIGGVQSVRDLQVNLKTWEGAADLLEVILVQIHRYLPGYASTYNTKGEYRPQFDNPEESFVVICPLSGEGTTHRMLEKAGFIRRGRDKRGDQRYMFCSGDLYHKKTTVIRRERMLKMLELLNGKSLKKRHAFRQRKAQLKTLRIHNCQSIDQTGQSGHSGEESLGEEQETES